MGTRGDLSCPYSRPSPDTQQTTLEPVIRDLPGDTTTLVDLRTPTYPG
ncbi:hypothetical protein ThimaDRAFT_3600 [Thiocapsa marina 5811]|uniref:Uncharacterized protein n=1 Tax=Thiocapsa marina 5811 TaxID=768671 RepID=F9UF97_9GAMM|nr:hypothetical protein ThimaDRAFT_3600 [Thiocapsa marina 5811]